MRKSSVIAREPSRRRIHNRFAGRVHGEFTRKYQKEKFGSTLPFVVITDSHGKALASSSGYKSPEAWTALIEEAKKKIAAKPGTPAR